MKENKKEVIDYLISLSNDYNNHAMDFGVTYNVINKTFSVDYEGKQYIINLNTIADLPNGEEIISSLKHWIHK